MNARLRKPRWWMLYLMFAIVVGLLWLESRSLLTPVGHQAAEAGIVLVAFALFNGWLCLERVALMRLSIEDAANCGCTSRIVEWEQELTEDLPEEEALSAETCAEPSYSQLFGAPVIHDGRPDQERNVA